MRLVIADDHKVVRDGIRYMLADAPGIEIVAEASSGEELIEWLVKDPVDVVLLDVRMPGMSGFDVLERLQDGLAQVRVIMLSMHDAPGYVRRAIELGAAGYLLKSASRKEVIAALEAVIEGGAYVQGELMQPLMNEISGKPGSGTALSPRERQVLQLVSHGYENKQIVTELELSEATVKTYLRGIFQRLDVASRAEAVAVGLRLGIID
ncbi:MAG: response regulator transcription factor [Actinomycetota bacterium]|nr:response regulator transcription factor [Actinomycetota bacterium]